jgi:glycosyltransferase involved in cell wall biosynthesis
MAKLFYIVKSEMLAGGVIEAQTVASLRAQAEFANHPPAQLIFLEAAGLAMSRAARASLKRFRAMWPAGKIRLIPFSSRLGDDAPGHSLALALARERLGSSELIFHCRAPDATLQADVARRWLGRGRVVFDLRGAAPYEAIHARGYAWADNLPPEIQQIYDKNLARDREAAAAADYVLTVSPGLRRYALEQLNVAAERLAVMPSCVAGLSYDEAARLEARTRWGVADDAPVLLYAGQLAADRLPRHLFALFAAMRNLRSDARLVILSYLNKLDDLRGLLAEYGVPETALHIAAHSRDETLRLLCGADAAALFLEPALRYQYCFPIKIPEYLSAGLPLVLNDGFEWIPELAQTKGLGWVVPTRAGATDFTAAARDIVAGIATRRVEMRQNSLAACEDIFIWPRYREILRRAYGLNAN